MSLSTARVYIGSLDVAVLNGVLMVDVRAFSTVSVQYQARYGASVGAWVGKVQRTIIGSPVDFATPVSFTSGILDVVDIDTNGVDTLAITTTTIGTSGVVDIYLIGKSV